jgi:integrase/recombinase XerD
MAKKRRQGVYHSVPVPPALLRRLDLGHGRRDSKTTARLWPWGRPAGETRLLEIMTAAGLAGPQTTPKGRRQGCAVFCIERNIPLNLVQKWRGHASLSTTAMYLHAVGEEERGIAARLWSSP